MTGASREERACGILREERLGERVRRTQAVPTEARHRQRLPGELERRREQIFEEQVGTMEKRSEEAPPAIAVGAQGLSGLLERPRE